MNNLSSRSVWGHALVLIVWATGFYALILNPYELDDLAKGAFIGFMGLALQWEFGTAIASATARQQQNATTTGAAAGATISREEV